MKYLKYKPIITLYLFPALVIVLSIFLLSQYFVTGVYKWHIAQPGNLISVTYVLSIVAGTVLIKPGRVKSLVLIGVILLYSIFTGVTGSLLLLFYYLMGFYLLGLKYYNSGLAIQLSYGVIFFVLFRSILSIVSNNLLVNEILLVAFMASMLSVSIRSGESFSDIVKNIVPKNRINIIFVVISLVTVGLNIATRGYDHDSLWYPLRSNALYFYNNFFSDNAFYGQVHYYPKLWESLTNNIFIEYNYSYGASLSASLYAVLSVIVYSLFEKNRIINTLLVITIPVVVGLSFSLKTDLLLLVIFMMAFLGVEKRRYDIVISAILLSFCVKNSAVLFVIAILFYLYVKSKESVESKDEYENNYIIIFISFVVLVLFLFRTYQLTGVLMANPNSLVKIQEMFGFEYVLPKRSAGVSSGSIFDVYKMIFFPEGLAHHRFFYNGYLWAASIFFLDKFIAVLLLLVLFVVYSVPGLGDGNYYPVLTVILTILLLRKVKIGKVGYVIILSNIVIGIVANPNWKVPKVPAVRNVCSTVICSDDKSLNNSVMYFKMAGLKEVINDKDKRYFVISSDKNTIIWQLFHRYNVAHIREFHVWNKIIKRYTLQEYIDTYIDIVILENGYEFGGDISGFVRFKVDDKYSYYSKIPLVK